MLVQPFLFYGCCLVAQRHLVSHDLRQVGLLQAVLFFIELVDLAGPVHAAELRSAHAAKGCFLVVIVRQRLIVHRPRRFRIE